jgi:hypothetical protein
MILSYKDKRTERFSRENLLQFFKTLSSRRKGD